MLQPREIPCTIKHKPLGPVWRWWIEKYPHPFWELKPGCPSLKVLVIKICFTIYLVKAVDK
jgi:hypothetical protein